MKHTFKYTIFKVILITCFASLGAFAQAQHTFKLADSVFLLDNKPFQIISGEMHYPRIPREAWRDRMKMAKAMGLNTIGTYVFWNVHEPQKDKFDFLGNNDIAEFVRIAKEEGLWVLLRPSPYVCAEWEFGGYPFWLQNIKGLQVRSKEAQYLKEYKEYLTEIGKRLAPLQINHGGNILMVQVENEYGSYGNDKEYLKINTQLFKDAGFDGVLSTCDPVPALEGGHLAGLLPGVNGIDNPAQIRTLINKYNNGTGPYFVPEWYPAWFDWWGTKHHQVDPKTYANKLDTVLKGGISINMYMFHGGTTRGFMNGANYNDSTAYEPQISSYDYDAPLDEAGNATPKFMLFREAIKKNLPANQKLPVVPAAKPAAALPVITFTKSTDIFNLVGKPQLSEKPLTFEALNQPYGFVLYSSTIKGGRKGVIKISELRDYGLVYINKKLVGVLDRRLYQDSLIVNLPAGNVQLDILVENMGRINFGPYLLKNNKGITKSVTFNGTEIKSWKMYPLPFDKIDAQKTQPKVNSQSAAALKSASFNLTKVADTYLDMRKWGKGVVWVNGHNLGKYWGIGPQQTIYLPAEWLKKGKNEIVVFELLKPTQHTLTSLDKAILNELKNK
ncbi:MULTISPECIES: beta-galactosidase family protein [unclassified Pedobacter]|uniref:glycoside hydrolase family 35 protein n=1 Tax=unclassified Pedobacter TaxID=2628915 RepID=UPI001D8440C5|nr:MULTISPECIES: beta-galactosidase family protein [unclassified Pedobacter]CAH0129346.1 Beta-galactosidase [Pedobacter sp. Bi126]CAH0229115.1 Beta-galactosidase [Pedobacter sp. Bi36]